MARWQPPWRTSSIEEVRAGWSASAPLRGDRAPQVRAFRGRAAGARGAGGDGRGRVPAERPREKTFADRAGASGRIAAGQMWKYEGDRLVSMCGERDSLVLTAQWVETPGSGLQDEGGRLETILCNAEGSMNHMAHQHWQLCANGTIGQVRPRHAACTQLARVPAGALRRQGGKARARVTVCFRGRREAPDAERLLANARRADGAKIL